MILRKAFFLAKLYRNPWKTNVEIEKLQLNLLKLIVEHAYRTVPYYHNLFRSVNLSPQDIKKLEDIKKIPRTRKDDLQDLDIKQRLSSKYPLNKLTMYKTGELEVLVIADEQFNQQKEKDLENKLLKSLQLEKVKIRRVQKLKKTEAGKQVPFVSKVNM